MVSVTLIGAGYMGENHAHAAADHPTLELASVVDVDESRAAEVAERCGADATYTDPGPALDDAEAAVVASPERHHAEHAHAALDRDVHVLVEKPLTDDLGAAERLADRAADSDPVTATGFLLRCDPAHARAVGAARDGDLGPIVCARVKRTNTDDVVARLGARAHPLYYICIHDIDLLNWAVDAPVGSVTAAARRGKHADHGIPDAIQALLTFESGATAVVEGYSVLPEDYPKAPETALELTGEEGATRVRTPGDSLSVHADRYDYPDTRHWPVLDGRMDGAVGRQMDRFAAAIGGDTVELATVTDGYRAQAVADAIGRAAESGERVGVAH